MEPLRLVYGVQRRAVGGLERARRIASTAGGGATGEADDAVGAPPPVRA